jgi:predicted metal-binding protein
MHRPSPEEKKESRLKELINSALLSGGGMLDLAVISPGDILVEDALADICRKPGCSNFGLSPSCPPHVSGPPGFRAWLKKTDLALFIRINVPTERLYSYERREIMMLLHETVATIENAALQLGYTDAKAFAGDSCKNIFCSEHPDCRVLAGGKCRNPQSARPSMSGFGVDVSRLIKSAGWAETRASGESNSKPDSMAAVYGLILIEEN